MQGKATGWRLIVPHQLIFQIQDGRAISAHRTNCQVVRPPVQIHYSNRLPRDKFELAEIVEAYPNAVAWKTHHRCTRRYGHGLRIGTVSPRLSPGLLTIVEYLNIRT
jgi:hypothetical protein